ncbi:uncharacterized protein V1516DRAFT_670618 [Lipomyces oligophaga]|uniref:uncharacterized protein n=1 Tax=Lipomyces oligophaga TaxID=45792 RepID=UPI0034CD2AC0
MALLKISSFWGRGEVFALVCKCMIVFRKTFYQSCFRALILPVIFMYAISGSQYLYVPSASYGIGNSIPMHQLSDVLGSRIFVYLPSDDFALTDEIRQVMKTVTQGLPDSQVMELNGTKELLETCRITLRGSSNCFIAIEWHSFDSENKVYNYSLRADPDLTGIYAKTDNSDVQRYQLPAQWAVDSALLGIDAVTDSPHTIGFTSLNDRQHRDAVRKNFMTSVRNYLSAAFYLAIIGVVYHLAGIVAVEREVGLSKLMDTMGCRPSSRYFAFLISFSLFYLLGWILEGICAAVLLFKLSNGAIHVFFHILSGISNLCFALVLAQPFRHAQFAGIVSTGICILLGVMCIVQRSIGPHNGATSGVLGFIFPPMNYIFFMQECSRFEAASMPVSLIHVPPEGYVAPGIFYIGVVLSIPGYFFLAIGLDKWIYGVSDRVINPELVPENYALSLINVYKTYTPVSFQGLFWKSKKITPVQAVKDLSTSFRSGELSCLLGANGSGKTTTLDMISGLQSITSGQIVFNNSTSLGLCPQKNVMWDLLTVEQHIRVFGSIKGSTSTGSSLEKEVDALIKQCDLDQKRTTLSKNLSGGQKRKLQLACMFVGGSDVCCIDEVSSGLDPLSRRKIWEILLASRGSRTLILTTHFLDEADFLADDVNILVQGELRASGSPVTLKQSMGSGYRVFSIMPASGKELVYEAPDAESAISLVERLEAQGYSGARLSGPDLEGVFLKLVADSDPEIRELLDENLRSDSSSFNDSEVMNKLDARAEVTENTSEEFEEELNSDKLNLHLGSLTGFRGQLRTMLWKRVIVTYRNPISILGIVLVPLIVGGISSRFVGNYAANTCNIEDQASNQHVYSFGSFLSDYTVNLIMGTEPTIRSLAPGLQSYFNGLDGSNTSSTSSSTLLNETTFYNGYNSFIAAIDANYSEILPGGLYFDKPATLALRLDAGSDLNTASRGAIFSPLLMNAFNNIRANGTARILMDYSPFQYNWSDSTGDSLLFIVFFSLAFSVFPAFASLYPTVERIRHVRALHYSNGLRVLPLWTSHFLFDFSAVLVVCAILIGIFVSRSDQWVGPGYLFVVMVLESVASILMSYVISLFSESQLAAFAITAGYECAYFLCYILAYLAINVYVSARVVDNTLRILTYVMCVFSPVSNLVRATFVSLNLFSSLCNGEVQVSYLGSFHAFGQPILYLCIQSIALFAILIWWDSGRYRIRVQRKLQKVGSSEDKVPLNQDVATEIAKVEGSNNPEGLRIIHVSKQFGKNLVVDDVTFGVARGECLALLGPNGAGKSTMFNMIRGEIVPSVGVICVEDVTVSGDRARARSYLGVCPQFDSIDHMTAAETLEFYARLRGLKGDEMRHNVDSLIYAVGLTRFRSRMAGKLSGGNRRKLSLGIALMANPTVLLLDEPSSGMDAASKRVMWRTLSKVAGGRSIVLTTHSMEEASALAVRAGILAKSLLAVGTCDYLREQYGHAVSVHFICASGVGATTEEMNQIYDWACGRFPENDVTVEDIMYHGQVKLAIDSRGTKSRLDILTIIKAIETAKKNIGVKFYSVNQTSLEEVFLSIVSAHDIAEEGYRADGQAKKKSGFILGRKFQRFIS